MIKFHLKISAVLTLLSVGALSAQTTTYSYTGAVQTYLVPPCVTSVTINALGAQGGGTVGGLGGSATATVPVTPGSTLYVYVGGRPTAQLGPGGFNGGGATLALPCGGGGDGFPGGGASDVRTSTSLNDRLIVAGGGGGMGWSNGVGGAGGGTNGTDGAASWIAGTHGKGATQSAGGIGGYYSGNNQSAGNGSFGQGGDAGPPNTYCTGGGGGGGYYGGGGGYVSAGGGGSSYVSYPGSTSTSTVAGTNSGNGSVTITAIPGTPAAPAPFSGSNLVCAGASATYTISSVGGATGYTWTVPSGSTITSGQGTTSINVTFGSTSGNISVTADNNCGSSSATTYSVTISPAPTVTANTTSSSVCAGTSITLTGSGATSYTWSNGVTDGVSFVPALTNTYTVTGVNGAGCTNTATITVTVNAIPSVGATSTANAVCAGDNVTLNGTGASTYTWSAGVVDGVSFLPVSTNTYTVTGTDANGCSDTSSITVTVNALPTVVANVTNDTICTGSSVVFTGSGANTYSWSGGVTDGNSFTPASTNSYTVTGTDVNGCSDTSSINVIVNPIPSVSASAATNLACLSDNPLTLSGTPSGGTWSGPGVSGTTFNPTTAGSGSHVVTYTYTDAFGCTSVANDTITVDLCLGFNTSSNTNGVNIYPNPNNGVFNITLNNANAKVVIEVIDLQGRIVSVSEVQNTKVGFTQQLNLTKEDAGIYLVRVTADGSVTTQRITVSE
ncbi:MAG: hypothetical protein RL007_214 [Bacteroidota bacterium]